MRITEVREATSESGSPQRIVTWDYMDPRLAEPFSGVTYFTIAAGEIFEARIELTTDPVLAPEGGEGEGEAEGGEQDRPRGELSAERRDAIGRGGRGAPRRRAPRAAPPRSRSAPRGPSRGSS